MKDNSKGFRSRIYHIIEVSEGGNKISNVYDIFMLIAIIVSLLPLCTKSTERWTVIVDEITVAFFIIDYVLREITADKKYPELGAGAFLRYPLSFMAIVDLLSILPSLGFLGRGLKAVKLFRLVRTLKVFKTFKAFKAFKALKFMRYSNSIYLIARVIKEQKEALLTVGGLAVGYIFVAALIVFNVEPDSFPTFFEAVYWSCVSLTTVGYGDIYPISTAGRIVTMLSSFIGIAIVALPSGIITAGYMEALHDQQEHREDKA